MSHVGLSMRDGSQGGSPAKRPKHRRKGTVAGLFAGAVIIGLVAAVIWGGMALWRQFGQQPPPADFAGPGSGSVVVQVGPGDTVTVIGEALAEAGVVASAAAFVNATQGDDRANTITPGAYEMLLEMKASDAFERLFDPASRHENTVTLPEGLRIDQTVNRTAQATGIERRDLTRVLRSPEGLDLPAWARGTGTVRAEGFLFPATYAFDKDAKAKQVLQRFVDRFDVAAQEVGIEAAPDTVGISPYEALIVASLVQAEGREGDYAKIARVIYNRLDPQTWGGTFGNLQLDATLNYALKESIISLSEAQLRADGPYNTYTRQGLPPTPINSPGQEAISAAMNPAQGNWLYYVTTNPDTGETKFTASYREFLAFKAEFQRWLRKNPPSDG